MVCLPVVAYLYRNYFQGGGGNYIIMLIFRVDSQNVQRVHYQ